ncbi:hypothetical protein AB20_4564 [Escherichia coli 3-475-03_S1_C1]|nr:hypothetical protein AB20_4564 [Escherichia coli 3-475-03_S1_C1]
MKNGCRGNVSRLKSNRTAKFFHRVIFKLSHALCGYTVTFRQFMQCRFIIVIQPARADNVL